MFHSHKQRELQLCTQNDTLCNRSEEYGLIHLDQVFYKAMGDLSKEQKLAIARSTMYLVAALLTILMISIAGLFLSAELEQQAQQKAEKSLQIARQHEVAPAAKRSWTPWMRHGAAMLPIALQRCG